MTILDALGKGTLQTMTQNCCLQVVVEEAKNLKLEIDVTPASKIIK